MALIKVKDFAYGRLRAPDLDTQEEFLTHFGLIRSARTPTALYMRGTDPRHHLPDVRDRCGVEIGWPYPALLDDVGPRYVLQRLDKLIEAVWMAEQIVTGPTGLDDPYSPVS